MEELSDVEGELNDIGGDDSEEGEEEGHVNAYGSFVRTRRREGELVAARTTSDDARMVRK